MEKPSVEKMLELPIVDIAVPDVIDRMDIDPERIAELARSISEIGQLQPIVVRSVNGGLEIIAGRRRLMACKSLNMSHIKGLVVAMDDETAAVSRAAENLERVDLTPIEEATIYRALIDGHGMTVERVSKKIGKTPGTVKRRLDLLKMHPMLQQAVHNKSISMTVAEELWPISSETDLEYYLMFAVENGVTKEVARQWCKEWKDNQRRAAATAGGAMQSFGVNEPRPIYVSCDTCEGPCELGNEKLLRVCPTCWAAIKNAIKENG